VKKKPKNKKMESSSSSTSTTELSGNNGKSESAETEKVIPPPLKETFTDENFDEKTRGKGINGLQNVGNTCYMNSILQCLTHTKWLVKYMLTNRFLEHIKQNSLEMIMVYEINKLLRFMYYSSGQVLNPVQFFRYMQILSLKLGNGQFIGNNQHDASEFLTFVLDILHEGLAKPIDIPENILSSKEPHLESWLKTFKSGYSILVKEFFGQYHTRTICLDCKNISSNYDPFSILHLPIPPIPPVNQGNQASQGITLNDCLELFSKEEELDDDNKYKCDKCSSITNAHKMSEIWKAPNTLIICLKRFNKKGLKINTNVSFPLENYTLNTVNNEKNVYDLYAVCNHVGDLNGGHYFSYVKQDGNWYEINDGLIKGITNASRVVNHYAYILFYQKKDN
jgi:ubiquitin carboxyl-terminal hydrolase 2/21